MKLDNKRLRAWLIENEAAKAAAQERADKAAAQRELEAAQRERNAEKKHKIQIDWIGQSVYLRGDFCFHRKREHISLTKGTWYGKPYYTVANGKADCVFVDFPHKTKIVVQGDADNFSIMKLTRLS